MRKIAAIDHDDAWVALKIVRETVKKNDKKLVFVIVDSHGEILSLYRHADAMLSSVTLATNKAYTAARLRRPSSALGQKSRSADEGFDIASFGDARVTAFGGGLPILYDGMVIGAVGVSGLPEAEDIEIAQLAVDTIEARWRTTQP